MLFLSLATAFVTISCTKEDLSECISNYTLTINAFDAEGRELTTETVKDITLYVFDQNKLFLGVHTDITLGQDVELNYPKQDALMVVAWGNAAQGHQTLPTLIVGDKMETAFVSLLKTRAEMGTVQSPDDLFYGMVTLIKENRETDNKLPMFRKTSGVSITARRLKQYANVSDDNFSYVLRQTGDKISFEGREAGEYSNYIPTASFIENKDEFVAPIFNILTTKSNIEVDIFYNDILVATLLKSPDGKPLKVEPGQILNLLIDFTSQISVSVSVTPWGVQQIWKEFN